MLNKPSTVQPKSKKIPESIQFINWCNEPVYREKNELGFQLRVKALFPEYNTYLIIGKDGNSIFPKGKFLTAEEVYKHWKSGSMVAPRQIEEGEWLYMGCFIQKSEHPMLTGKYEVFKNDLKQSHVGRCQTFKEAKRLCEENQCTENVLWF